MGISPSLTSLRVGIVCLTFGLAAPLVAEQSCVDSQVIVKGDFGEARFSIELADEPAERSQGLMHRESMASSSAMLFVFEAPQPVAFWMKNTLISLDMIFIDRTGRILRIHENAIPHDETPIPGGNDVFAVLEINGGMSKKLGFRAGNALQHPSFSGGPAIFPCIE